MSEQILRPTSDEAANWSIRLGGTSHYLEVDETSQDGTTSYVYKNAAGTDVDDRYGLTDWTHGEQTIDKVEITVWAKYSTASPTLKPILYLGGSVTEGSAISLTTSFAAYTQELSKPGGGSWAYTDIDALQAGLRYTGTLKTHRTDVTQVYVTVTYSASGDSITLTAPDGGEDYYAGGNASNYNITWTQNGSFNVDIYYSTNGGTDWASIVSNESGGSPYSWDIPTAAGGTQSRVKIEKYGDSGIVDSSAANYDIHVQVTDRIPHIIVGDKNQSTRIANDIPFEAYVPTWWDTDYYKRKQIIFGTSHTALTGGETVESELYTGFEERIATNVIHNEGFPEGYEFSGTYNRLYVSYLGYPSGMEGALHIYMKYYDYDAAEWSSVADVVTSTTAYDTHYTPTLLVDNSGYIHLFYGCHNSQMKYIRSTNVEDITAWETAGTIGTAGSGSTYPEAVVDSSGNIYVFCREYQEPDSQYVFYKSTDNGANWSSMKVVADYPSTDSTSSGDNVSTYGFGCHIDDDDNVHIQITWHDLYLTDNKARGWSYFYTDEISAAAPRWYFPKDVAGGFGQAGQTDSDPIVYETDHMVKVTANMSTGPYFSAGGISIMKETGQAIQYYMGGIGGSHLGAIHQCYWDSTELEWVHTPTALSALADVPDIMSTRFLSPGYAMGGVLFYYGMVMPPSGTKRFGGELYRWKSIDHGLTWSHGYLTNESAYGCGGIYVLEQAWDTRVTDERVLIFGRGDDLHWSQDHYYPHIRTDGKDIRVILHQSGSADTELDRCPDRINAIDTQISFQIQSGAPVGEDLNVPTNDKAYYLYYDNPAETTTPNNDPSNVFTYYESFEDEASDSDVTAMSDWSGDSGYFKVCEAYDSTTWTGAHTNAIWSGYQFVFLADDTAGTDKAVTKTLALDNHYIDFHIQNHSGITTGDKMWLELYDSVSGDYIRFGINNDKFSYYKNGGSWTDTSQDADIGRLHRLRMLINSSGVSLWGDGVSVLTDDNHITECTSIKIGANVGVTANEILFVLDDITAWEYIADEPEMSTGEEEGEDDWAMARIANTLITEKEASTRIAQFIVAYKVATERMAMTVIGEKESLERVAMDITGDKELSERIAHFIDSIKEETERISMIAVAEKEVIERMAMTVIGDKEMSERIAQYIVAEKKEAYRIAMTVPTDKVVTERVASTLISDKEMIERIANTIMADKIDATRITHAIIGELEATERISSTLLLENVGTARIAQMLDPDKTMTERVSMTLPLLAEDVERVANILVSDKILSERVANTLLLDKEQLERIANTIVMDKTELERFASLIVLEATDVQRIANTLDLEYTVVVRIAHKIAVDKEVTERIANTIAFSPDVIERIAMMISGDKTVTERIAQLIVGDKTELDRIAMAVIGNKELSERIANTLTTESTLTERISNALLLDATGTERISNWLNLDGIATTRIASTIIGDKYSSERIANIIPLFYHVFCRAQITDQELLTADLTSLTLSTASLETISLETSDITSTGLLCAELMDIRLLTSDLENIAFNEC